MLIQFLYFHRSQLRTFFNLPESPIHRYDTEKMRRNESMDYFTKSKRDYNQVGMEYWGNALDKLIGKI